MGVICARVFKLLPSYYTTCIRAHCLSRAARTFKAKQITEIQPEV